jgi:hypothetical protein
LAKQKAKIKNGVGSAAIWPSMPSSQLISQCSSLDKGKSPEIAGEISQRLAEIRAGDMTYLEEMLLSQAISLNAFGADLLMKSGGFIQEGLVVKFPELTEKLAQLGLKAQDSSRKAIMALHELRNPKKPTQFIKNYVNQQLNQLQVEQEQLKHQLEATANAPVDIGSQSEAGRAYQAVGAVGEVHGASNRGRESDRLSEQSENRVSYR